MVPSTPWTGSTPRWPTRAWTGSGINARGKRYFSAMVYAERPELRPFVFGPTMAAICRAVLGSEAYLFWEQYVIKAADPDTTFAWHQDSGYVHEDHEPYLTCWIALDDVTEENGSVYLLPYSRSGIRSYVRHIRAADTGDQVCYFGADPGMPVIVPAGSIVCFSSTVIHRSGANLTDRLPPGLPAAVLRRGDHGQDRPATLGIVRAVPGRRRDRRRPRRTRLTDNRSIGWSYTAEGMALIGRQLGHGGAAGSLT